MTPTLCCCLLQCFLLLFSFRSNDRVVAAFLAGYREGIGVSKRFIVSSPRGARRRFLLVRIWRKRLVCCRSPSSSSSSDVDDTAVSDDNDDDSASLIFLDLQRQAEALRNEAKRMERTLNETKTERETKAKNDVDKWIEHVLVNCTAGNTQLLNTVDQAAQVLKDDRFSPEQVEKMFQRLCDTCPIVGRDSLDRNALLALLIDAAGKLDCTEREENPNKRWNHRVERDLRKKLFAKEWNIDLDKVDSDGYALNEAVGRFKDG